MPPFCFFVHSMRYKRGERSLPGYPNALLEQANCELIFGLFQSSFA